MKVKPIVKTLTKSPMDIDEKINGRYNGIALKKTQNVRGGK